MTINSINIDILKQHLDSDTLLKVATLEAERKAKDFKYRLNIFGDKKYPDKHYHQLKGTIGYNKKTKLWVSHYLGRGTDSTVTDSSAICSKYSTLMKDKAKDAILKELLK
jgi:hypothetical protein